MDKEDRKDLDYIYNKTCDMKYVGETCTGPQFRTRKQQHQRDVKNKIAINGSYNHLKHNRKHKIAWDDAVYIHHKS